MATYTRDHRLAEELWPQLVARAQQEGVQWRVLNRERLNVLAARVHEYAEQYGAVVLLIALEGYIARCRSWELFHQYCKPEHVYRSKHMAKNIEEGLQALEDRQLISQTPGDINGADREDSVF